MVFYLHYDYLFNIFVGLTILFMFFFVYYYFHVVRPPVLYCRSTKFKSFLKESMPIVSEKYWPTIWCCEGHFQTAVQFFCRVDAHVPYEREILVLDDGGQVALDWLHTKIENVDTPIILLLPGITGDSRDSYIKKFAINAREHDFRSVVFNYRGLGDVELKTPKLYSMSDTSDLEQVVQHIRNRFPTAVLGACGTSLGSFILAHYLIKHDQQERISFGMMNNTLFNLFEALQQTKNEFVVSWFSKLLAYNLRQTVARFKHVLDTEGTPWNMSEVMRTRMVEEFDEKLTAKMFGYSSLHEYYKEANLADKMDKIKIPMFCVNAADDPGQPLKYSEDNEQLLFDNDKVAVLITARGGHISHLEGLWPLRKKKTFLHRLYIQYFAAMFHNNSYKYFSGE